MGTSILNPNLGFFGLNRQLSKEWKLNKSNSCFSFYVKYNGVSTLVFEFLNFDASLYSQTGCLNDSDLYLSVDTSSVSSNMFFRDEHVKSSEFLDCINYPQLTFRSTSRIIDHKIIGNLTIKGVKKEIGLNKSYLGKVKSAFNSKINLEISKLISLKDFGLDYNKITKEGLPVVDNYIELVLDLEFN